MFSYTKNENSHKEIVFETGSTDDGASVTGSKAIPPLVEHDSGAFGRTEEQAGSDPLYRAGGFSSQTCRDSELTRVIFQQETQVIFRPAEAEQGF